MGMEFDENGGLMAAIEKRAREEVFPEYLEKMRAKGFEVELFDLEPLEYPPVDIRMKYAKRKCWGNSERLLCELDRDGSVDFANDITPAELKLLVTSLLRECEIKRQRILENWCGKEKETSDN